MVHPFAHTPDRARVVAKTPPRKHTRKEEKSTKGAQEQRNASTMHLPLPLLRLRHSLALPRRVRLRRSCPAAASRAPSPS